MVQLTTQQVKVGAQSTYQDNYSDPLQEQYVFSYRIRITNEGRVPVQLLDRAWTVISASGERREVEGKGVVGEQPQIMPGHTHEYTSWVQFDTPLGAMKGSYGMVRHDKRGRPEYFSVEVPRFLHIAPSSLN